MNAMTAQPAKDFNTILQEKWYGGVPASAIALLLDCELHQVFRKVVELGLPCRDAHCRVLTDGERLTTRFEVVAEKLRRLLKTGSIAKRD